MRSPETSRPAIRITAVPRSGHPNSGLQAMRFAAHYRDEVWALPAPGRYVGTYGLVRFSGLDGLENGGLLLWRAVRAIFMLTIFIRALSRRDRLYFVHSFAFAVPLRLLRTRFCIFIHGSDRRFLRLRWARWLIRGAVDCFGVGFAETLGDVRVKEVPNVFAVVPSDSEAGIQFDLAFVLRIAPVKNPHYPILLCEHVGRALSLKVAVVGVAEDELAAQEKQRLDRLRLDGVQIEYLGRQPYEEVISVMRKSHALMIPSHSEGIPKVMLEAMSQGLAVIANDQLVFPADLDSCVRKVALHDWEALSRDVMEVRNAERSAANVGLAHAYLEASHGALRDLYDEIYEAHDKAN